MICRNRFEMEEVASEAWPVPWRENHDSFEFRASPEDSNRANCVRLIDDHPVLESMLIKASGFFSRHRRPVQIAVPVELTSVDRDLDDRGFVRINPSLYMSRKTPGREVFQLPEGVVAHVEPRADSAWLAAWAKCAELGPATDAHFTIARAIQPPSCFVSVDDEVGGPLAVGTAVYRGRWRCFENLVTRRDVRGQGLGSLVVQILTAQPNLAEACDMLQVDEGNPAIRLYRRQGFEPSWRYHYRREPPRRSSES